MLDEHLSPTVAHRLTELGFLVECARDRGLLRLKDWELLPWCVEQGFAICTRNGPHFERLHKRCADRGEEHLGILIAGDWPMEAIFEALREYLESGPDPALLKNQVIRLSPPAEGTP